MTFSRPNVINAMAQSRQTKRRVAEVNMIPNNGSDYHLDLLNNSLSFFREAVDCFARNETGPDRLKFAIIHLVQSMELALKESLHRINPILIYEDIDKPKNTVSITKAIQRLQSKTICATPILSTDDEVHYRQAIDLRNSLVHAACTFTAEGASARFSGLFTYMLAFYDRHLGTPRSEILSQSQIEAVLAAKETKQALMATAEKYLATGDHGEVIACPECGEDCFVVEDQKCCLCHYAEAVQDCPNCGLGVRESELVDLSGYFDWDYSEGLNVLHDRCGIEADRGCPYCEDDVRQKVHEYKYSQQAEDEAMERYYAVKRARGNGHS